MIYNVHAMKVEIYHPVNRLSMLWKKIEKEKQTAEWNALQAHNTVYALQAKYIFT